MGEVEVEMEVGRGIRVDEVLPTIRFWWEEVSASSAGRFRRFGVAVVARLRPYGEI